MTDAALQRFDERFAGTGGIGAKAAQNAFGRPNLGRWDLFLRESLQNSWDARRSDEDGIVFSIRAGRLGQDASAYLRDVVFRDRPTGEESEFHQALESRDLAMLVVEDARTHGLAGPVQGDAAVPHGGRSDYRDFVMSYGHDEQKGIQGGTFGLGKAALYNASAMRTCLIYSQTHDEDGRFVYRFVSVFNGREFAADEKRYTGRRYWGNVVGSGATTTVEPVTGDAARALALSAGLTHLEPDETGTSIGILAPFVEETESLESIIDAIREAALKWAWPHMVRQNDLGMIDFRFSVNGDDRPIWDPMQDDRYRDFVQAYLDALTFREEKSGDSEVYPTFAYRVAQKTPKLETGVLVLRSTAPKPKIPGQEHFTRHVALMRKPRFIVTYMKVAEPAAGQWLRGVFLAADDVDAVFGRSEPPSHDDWVQPNGAEFRGMGVRRTKEIIAEKAALRGAAAASIGKGSTRGLVRLADSMGSLVTGGGKSVLKRPSALPKDPSSGVKPEVSAAVSSNPLIVQADSGALAIFDVHLSTRSGVRLEGWSVVAYPVVQVFGGVERKTPEGAVAPEIAGWSLTEGQVDVPGSVIPAHLIPRKGASVVVRVPQRVAVGLEVRAEPND